MSWLNHIHLTWSLFGESETVKQNCHANWVSSWGRYCREPLQWAAVGHCLLCVHKWTGLLIKRWPKHVRDYQWTVRTWWLGIHVPSRNLSGANQQPIGNRQKFKRYNFDKHYHNYNIEHCHHSRSFFWQLWPLLSQLRARVLYKWNHLVCLVSFI